MANTVSFIFVAQDRFNKIIRSAQRSTTGLRKKVKGLGKEADTTRRKTHKMAKGFSASMKNMLGAAVGFIGAQQVTRIGTQFQDSMADLSAITGASGEDLRQLQDTIFRLGKKSSTSAAEVATAFKLVASAKPELLDNLAALAATTEQVLLLKNASGIELASAANIAAQGLNIFGAGADQAARFVNVLAAGAKLGSSEIADTGEALLIAGPGARAAGLSFEQLNAAIQAVAKGGIKGARSGTALNAIFGRLQRAGIDFQKLGLQGSFEIVKKKMDSLKTSTQRAQFASKIFGEEHSKVGFAILDNVKLLSQYEKSLAGTNIAQEQADIRLATFSKKFAKLQVILSEKVIKTFLRLEPVLVKQAERFADFLENIKPEQLDSFANSLKALLEVAVLIGDAFKILGAMIKGVGTAVGELAAQITLGNFSDKLGTSFKDAFSIGGKFLGVFGGEAGGKTMGDKLTDIGRGLIGMPEPRVKTDALNGGTSRTDVNVNLRAPQGAIESIKSRTSGKAAGLNVGVNMVTAQ